MTILDDDKPGTFQMNLNHMHVKKSEKTVRIVVNRVDGSDGEAHVCISSADIANCPNPATEGLDFEGFQKELNFGAGISEMTFEVKLLDHAKKNDDDEESKIFMVLLSDPTPQGCRLSKKNSCQLEIVPEDFEVEQSKEDQEKMIEYFVEQNEESWGK